MNYKQKADELENSDKQSNNSDGRPNIPVVYGEKI